MSKMCKNCMLKFMKAIDLFFYATGHMGADWKRGFRKCTQLKRRKGTECFDALVNYLADTTDNE